MESQPIQIISSEDHKFILQDLDDVKRILAADELNGRELIVVSIAGALRQGKSFLLNYFLRYLNARVGKKIRLSRIRKELEEFKRFKTFIFISIQVQKL